MSLLEIAKWDAYLRVPVLTIQGVSQKVYTAPVDPWLKSDGIEWELTYASKPSVTDYAIPISYNKLKATAQPPLTADEVKRGCVRPDQIVNSLALYYPTLRNGESNKIGHVLRPQLVDAKGAKSWVDTLVFDPAGYLKLSLPKTWMNNASYPVVLDPTFGKTTIGGSVYTYWGYGPRDEKIACLYPCTEAGTGTSMSAYCSDYNDAGKANALRMGFYNTSNALLGSTAVGNIPASSTWVPLNFIGSPSLSVASYWLTAQDDDLRTEINYDTGSAGQTKGNYPDDFADGLSDPFGTAEWTEAFALSIYLTYTPAAGGLSIPVAMRTYRNMRI